MLKKSHRALAVAISPLFFIKVENINATNFEIINVIINKYNIMVDTLLSISIILPLFLIIYLFSSTLPDIDHKFKYFYKKEDWSKRYLYHRQTTHSILLVVSIFIWSLLYGFYYMGPYSYLVTAVSLGIFAHILGDVITGSVPWLLYAPYYRRFQRIGITIFLPRIIHPVFTDKFPKFIDKNIYKIFIPMFLFTTFTLLINLGYFDKDLLIKEIVLN